MMHKYFHLQIIACLALTLSTVVQAQNFPCQLREPLKEWGGERLQTCAETRQQLFDQGPDILSARDLAQYMVRYSEFAHFHVDQWYGNLEESSAFNRGLKFAELLCAEELKYRALSLQEVKERAQEENYEARHVLPYVTQFMEVLIEKKERLCTLPNSENYQIVEALSDVGIPGAQYLNYLIKIRTAPRSPACYEHLLVRSANQGLRKAQDHLSRRDILMKRS